LPIYGFFLSNAVFTGAAGAFDWGFYFYGTAAFPLDPFPAGTAGAAFPPLLLLSGFLITFDAFTTSFLAAGGGGADFLAPPFAGSGGFFDSSTFFFAAGAAVFFGGYALAITCIVKI
jgi:hypothetical protein